MKEIIILTIIIIINIPIIYFTVISLFFKEISPSPGTGIPPAEENPADHEQVPEREHVSAGKNPRISEKEAYSSKKIPVTPVTIIKSIILIAFIIGLFAGELILIDKMGMIYFNYHFIQNLLGFSPGSVLNSTC